MRADLWVGSIVLQLMKYEIMTPVETCLEWSIPLVLVRRKINKAFTMTWKVPVILPRTSLGEHSDTYAGATADIPPMPNPEITRPA